MKFWSTDIISEFSLIVKYLIILLPCFSLFHIFLVGQYYIDGILLIPNFLD